MISQTTNCRRCPPSASISIPPQKRRKLSQGNDGGSKSGSPPNTNVETSAEERAVLHRSDSAGTWFKQVNENVQPEPRKKSTYDEEPPFYIDSQVPYRHLPQSGAPSRAFGVVPKHADSEKEDLRDVIDDLTVENKKLKQKLRSHRTRTSRTSSSRAEDKLFEVRVHGMRPEKKRELEMLLKNFATSLKKDSIPSRSTASRSSDQVPSGSSLSNSRPSKRNHQLMNTDSGYGSNSTSNFGRHMAQVSSVSKDQEIKSYLQKIPVPDSLLPTESYPMSDEAKMGLVVRRLEQLFTGRQASPDGHQQPIQQQEVSRFASPGYRQEDALRSNKRGHEGTREAHILPLDAHLSLEVAEAPLPAQSLHAKITPDEKPESPIEGSSSDPGVCNSPEQRPTRPLDLDIGRAQVAQENLEYIRHLGLEPPGFDQAGKSKSQWIYLNLLTSMAQLHTLNVTPDFVRTAIRKRSSELELSKDLHQVRWKGGADTTLFSKETEQAMEHTSAIEPDSALGKSAFKRSSNADSASNGRVSLTPSDDQTSREESSNAIKQTTLGTSFSSQARASIKGMSPSAFDYKPLFYGRNRRLRREVSSVDDSASSAATDSTGLAEKMSRSNLSIQSQHGEGMITFFNNAYFCSDFSADKHPSKYVKHKLSILSDFSIGILGIPQPVDFEESALRHHDACYYAPQFATKFTPPKHEQPINFEPEAVVAAGEDETQPIEMEASGLGMIVPADNFAIDVKVAREPGIGRHMLKPKSRLPEQKNVPAQFQYQVESARHVELQPSRLPSPSYVFASSSSSGQDGVEVSVDGSAGSSSPVDVSPAPLAFFRHPPTESSRELGSNEYMEDDDSSVDMLRDARADNPERTAAQEREYLLNHPGAAMTVSPSLAATVGTLSV